MQQPSFIATKSSQIKKEPHDFKIVVHNNYKKKQQPNKISGSKAEERDLKLLDMKKARFEVYKFSKSDLNFSNRQKSNVELAIQLGAKPPKKKATNYKQLLEEKLKKAYKKKEDNFVKQISLNYRSMMADKKKKQSSKVLRSKPNNQGILGIYGKVKKSSQPKTKQ